MDLFDLEEGDLFCWDAQPYEIYRLLCSPNEAGTALVRCVLYRNPATGIWTPASRDNDENFNGYAYIRKVAVSIEVE